MPERNALSEYSNQCMGEGFANRVIYRMRRGLRREAAHFKMSCMASRVKTAVPFFPLMLNISAKKCVVVGAGTVAAGKIRGLLMYGAKIVVVSPQAAGEVQALARAGKIKLLRREFAPLDVKGALLVIAATNSPTVNASVFRVCRAQRILCNSVDDPEHCDFFYPAVVRRGALQIAISTNGNLPALAARLREELEDQFGAEWAEWLEQVGTTRRRLLASKMPAEERCTRLLRLASADEFHQFAEKRKAK